MNEKIVYFNYIIITIVNITVYILTLLCSMVANEAFKKLIVLVTSSNCPLWDNIY